MKQTPIIVAIAVIVAIVGVVAITMNQEEIQVNENDSENNEAKPIDQTPEEKQIDEKLDEIERKAEEIEFTPKPRNWQTSGPFQIDRTEYYIGEKIFIRIGGLETHEKGQIAFLRPLNDTHHSVYQTISFDGMQKPAFNYYTQASLSKQLQICSIDDIIGEWTVVFRGTDYPNLKFTIIDEILPGEEDAYYTVC